MSFILTFTGREYSFDGLPRLPGGEPAICIEDIAHHLAQLPRFCGATHVPYSVAQHSLLVSFILECRGATPATALAGLMHDAHEAYIGDISTPVKHAINLASGTLGGAWRMFERTHAHAVAAHFGLSTAMTSRALDIHWADLCALALEREHLMQWMPGHNTGWDVLRDEESHDSVDNLMSHEADNTPGMRQAIEDHFERAVDLAHEYTAIDRLHIVRADFKAEFGRLRDRMKADADAQRAAGADMAAAAAGVA